MKNELQTVQVDQNVKQSTSDALLRTMDQAGWSLDWIDLDLTGCAPKLEIRASRYDGLWIHAYVDELGRAMVESFHRESRLGMRDHEKGCRPMVPLIDDHFMGRRRYEGARALLRGLCAYFTDNALHPILLSDMRVAWAAIMQKPIRLQLNFRC